MSYLPNPISSTIRSLSRFLPPLAPVVIAVLAFLAAGCSAGTTPNSSDTAPAERADPRGVSATESGDEEDLEASRPEPLEDRSRSEADSSREWRLDEEGKRYYEKRMPKVEGHYRVSEDGGTVFLPPGLRYDLVRVEEDAFVVRIYDSREREALRREGLEDRGWSDRGRAAAGVETTEPGIGVEKGDRARLARTDRGLPGGGQWRQGFEVVDLNGDGHLDLVHGPRRKGGTVPRVFLGDSRGRWNLWEDLVYEGPPLDYGDVAVADFDGDGFLDLAFAVHLRGLLIARGDGEGRFTYWPTDLRYQVPGEGGGGPEFTSRTIESVDWNRDGRPDLLTVSEGPTMARGHTRMRSLDESRWGVGLFLNQGDGRWLQREGEMEGNPPFGDDLALGDFDGDGILDFATANHAVGTKRILYFGREDGSFTQKSLPGLPHGLITAVETADFDADGRMDLAVGMNAVRDSGGYLSALFVFHSRPERTWERTALAAEEDGGGVWTVGAGDLDGDGRTDLVGLTGMGDRWVFLRNADGGFVREESPEMAPSERGCRGYEARLVDLDGDGLDEMILAFAGEPGTEVLFTGADVPKQCPSGGSLEVWGLVSGGEGS